MGWLGPARRSRPLGRCRRHPGVVDVVGDSCLPQAVDEGGDASSRAEQNSQSDTCYSRSLVYAEWFDPNVDFVLPIGREERYLRKAQLVSGRTYKRSLRSPQFVEHLGRYVTGCVPGSCGGYLSRAQCKAIKDVHRFGYLRNEPRSHECGVKLFLVRSSVLVKGKHRLARKFRAREVGDLRSRLKCKCDVLSKCRQEFVVCRQADVSPLSRMVSTPQSLLVADRQPTTQGDAEQGAHHSDRIADQVHRLQPLPSLSIEEQLCPWQPATELGDPRVCDVRERLAQLRP